MSATLAFNGLSKRKPCVRINSERSSLQNIRSDIPQDSVVGPQGVSQDY